MVTLLLAPKGWVAFAGMAIVEVLEMLTKAGVGIILEVVAFVRFAARIPLTDAVVSATACCCTGAIVGTNGGGVVGVAIILPDTVVILPP